MKTTYKLISIAIVAIMVIFTLSTTLFAANTTAFGPGSIQPIDPTTTEIQQIGGKIFHSSFFIYLYHAFLVFVLRELLIMVINPTSTIMWIITYILLVLTTIFILVLAFIILNKYLPSFTAIITGGRSNKK